MNNGRSASKRELNYAEGVSYVDKKGQVVIKPEFFVAEDFSEGLAAVRSEESATSKYAFINKTGSIVIPAQFDQAYSFSEGLAAVETGFRAEAG